MSFPSVVFRTEYAEQVTAITAHNIPFYGRKGDRVVIVFALPGGTPQTISVDKSFTDLSSHNNNLHVIYKDLDGTESGFVTVTIGVGAKACAIAWNIQGHNPAQAPELSSLATAISANPDPGSVTPTGGARDYLWLAAAAHDGEAADTDTQFTAAPTNYINLIQKTTGTGGASNTNSILATAERQSNSSSEDPGTFTATQVLTYEAFTIAIHPVPVPAYEGTDRSGFGGGNQAWGEAPWGAEPAVEAGGNVTMPAAAGSYSITGGAANFKISIPVDPGSYTITGSDVTPKISMPAASGSYSITGGAATLEAIRHIIIEAGSYAITGSDVTPKISMPAASGTYNITGTNASLLAARKLALDAGSYTLSGTDAALAKGRTLDAESGSYAITGQDAGLRAIRLLIIGSGSYALSGTDAGLLKGRTLAIDAGSYTIQGVEASLEAGREVVAGAGSYSITGGAVNFKVLLPAVSGSYVLTGQDVTFILFAPARIQAESGFYAIVGTDANLTSSAARRRTGAASQASLAALAWQAEFQDEEDVISYL